MYLDEEFVKIAGSRISKFKAAGRNRYQCRCPICGGSKSDKNKISANFYIYKGDWMFKCFKCSGKAYRIPAFLAKVFPDLYDEYIMGKHTKNLNNNPEQKTTEKAINRTTEKAMNPATFDLPKLSELSPEHHSVTYIRERKIPDKYLHELYYVKRFKQWSNTLVPGTFEKLDFDDERIVIPFRSEKGEIFAFQGRSIGKSSLKYLTVKIDPEAKKVYGLDKVDFTKNVFVVEGPFDSMFLENAICTGDSGLSAVKNGIYIWDNEPRSKQIIAKMEMVIEENASIVIWPSSARFNDINDAVQNYGYTPESIRTLVNSRIFSGLNALLELNNWRKA